ncbi:MAG: hypothetical protein CL862_02240 [Cyanobium sp. NAT70]|nr:hypothetical protein [Cyanobium sp. NAT70]|tara:strand:+ start:2118 stop:2645 length:528 start_codon:yes stop_codon:yes gene_type:complete
MILFGLIAGCEQESSPSADINRQPLSQRSPTEQIRGPVNRVIPDLGLTPLPTAQQVKAAAPGGRADPFAPLPQVIAQRNSDATNPMNPDAGDTDGQADLGAGLKLTGVIRVGGQQRAFVRTDRASGVVCVGPQGRCGVETPLLLPAGWSVLTIDVQRGCIRLEQNGKPQEAVCMA